MNAAREKAIERLADLICELVHDAGGSLGFLDRPRLAEQLASDWIDQLDLVAVDPVLVDGVRDARDIFARASAVAIDGPMAKSMIETWNDRAVKLAEAVLAQLPVKP